MFNSARINQLEISFWKTSYNGTNTSSLFVIEEGTVPIMLSAPHAMRHPRNGKLKAPEVYTGSIVKYLHEVTGCHIIYSTKLADYDANYDELCNNPYQRSLIDYIQNRSIKFLLDIHGMTSDRKFAVELGTAPSIGSSMRSFDYIVPEMVSTLSTFFGNGAVGLNVLFCADGKCTVTKVVSSRCNIPCIQVEINALYRSSKNEELLERMLTALRELIVMLVKSC